MLSNLKNWLMVAVLVGSVLFAYHEGYTKADNKWQQEVNNEYVKKQEATQATQIAVNEISKAYQDDLAALEGSTDRVIADLHLDGKRLRAKLKDKPRDQSGDSGCFSDGRAELDEEFSRRLIRVTQRGDLWIKALQDTIIELKKKQED